MTAAADLRTFIRSVPHFPKPGIMFRDITPLLDSPGAFRQSIEQLAAATRALKIDKIVAAEARGFLFATPLAMALDVGVVPVRKPGKLPFDKHSYHYDLEYGSDCLEIHVDAVQPGQRVLLVDDLLATGGTMRACAGLVERLGAEVAACAFVIELTFLPGRRVLEQYPVISLLQYDNEEP